MGSVLHHKMKRNAELSINLIFAIVISAVAISILLAIILTKTPMATKVYCSTVESMRTKILDLDQSPKCYSPESLLSEKNIKLEKQNVNTFMGSKKEHILRYQQGKNYAVSFKIPTNAIINNASINLEFGKKSVMFDEFVHEGTPKSNFSIYIPNGYTPSTLYLNISRNVEIKNATFSITAKEVPPLLDLVFVLDTSGSMTNEWDALCENFIDIKNNLSNSFINYSLSFYGMNTGKVCSTGLGITVYATPLYGLKEIAIANGIKFNTTIELRPTTSEGIMPELYPAFDDVSESWAPGIMKLSNMDIWRTNAKRLLFPISDSDPTGAYGSSVYYGRCNALSESKFSNETFGEELSVTKAIEFAKQKSINVFPVYGDDWENCEGFHVGCEIEPGANQNCCTTTYSDSCGKIIGWMQMLADDTGGQGIGFKDKDQLLTFILNAVHIAHLTDPTLNIGGTKQNIINGELSKEVSPLVVDITLSLNDSIQNDCTSAFCYVPINITSLTEGSINIHNISILFAPIAQYANLTIGNTTLYYREDFPVEPKIIPLDIKDAIIDYVANNCIGLEECEVPVFLSASSPEFEIELKLEELMVDYSVYPVYDDILNAVLECWNKANQGKSSKDFTCTEISLPPQVQASFDESKIASMIKSKNYCHIIGSDAISDCGLDNIDVDISSTNIVIEYKNNKILVS